MVYFGSEPGSKSYRLYDPKLRRIMVARHVIIDENSSWSWEKEVEPTLETRDVLGSLAEVAWHRKWTGSK